MIVLRASQVSDEWLHLHKRAMIQEADHVSPSDRALPYAEPLFQASYNDDAALQAWDVFCAEFQAYMEEYQHSSGACLSWEDGNLWLVLSEDEQLAQKAGFSLESVMLLDDDYVWWTLATLYPCHCGQHPAVKLLNG